jgi:hypothetical protein
MIMVPPLGNDGASTGTVSDASGAAKLGASRRAKDPARRVMKATMKMIELDIATLQQAYVGDVT